MRAILVDDEAFPLEQLKKLLDNDIKNIEVIGAYLNPLEAETMIEKFRPDIVFLDIEMPELNGLQLGERIQEAYPEIDIIFVTAFDRYAVQAFELYAIDYIMKPIPLERLKTTIQRIQESNTKQISTTNKVSKHLGCFNTISVKSADGTIETIKWRTSKAQELFAYMLHHRNQVIYRDTILELLWPDFDISRGSKQLYTTIYHIRQTLKKLELDNMTISRQSLDNGYRLDMGTILIDIEQWEEQIKTSTPISYNTIEKHESTFHAYQGHYLGAHDYIWIEGERERLRRLWLNQAKRLHSFYLEHNMTNKAIIVNERIQQLAPVEELSYFNLMKLYDLVDNAIVVEAQYEKLMLTMEEQLDASPNSEITAWYEQWKRQKHDNVINRQ